MNANEQQKIIQKTEQTLLAYCKRQGLFKGRRQGHCGLFRRGRLDGPLAVSFAPQARP